MMNDRLESADARRWLTAVAAVTIALTGAASSAADDDEHMSVRSATFTNGGTLPLSMISNIPGANGQNSCTADGSAGGNESPQLTWKHAPEGTRSFVVIAYDVVAQFTHWQMYNIPATTTSLPENAGIPGSAYGVQNANDFFQTNYNGPCPPTAFKPYAHLYVFTVYALDRILPVVPAFGDFVPTGPEGLYQELIAAGQHGHILASASIEGYFSAVPGG